VESVRAAFAAVELKFTVDPSKKLAGSHFWEPASFILILGAFIHRAVIFNDFIAGDVSAGCPKNHFAIMPLLRA
jgi:hypothetical protein